MTDAEVKKVKDADVPERDDEDILGKAPIMVLLGGKSYAIKPLVIKKSREWRKKLKVIIDDIKKNIKIDPSSPADFIEAFTFVLIEAPDKVMDLMFEYDDALMAAKEEIENTATDAEAFAAIKTMLQFVYPFVNDLPSLVSGLTSASKSTTIT